METKFYQVQFSASFREHTIFSPFFNVLMRWHTLILPALYLSTWWLHIYSLDSICCIYLVSFTSISVREIGLSFSIIRIPLSHTGKKIIPPQEWAGGEGFLLSLLKSLWNISIASSVNVWKNMLLKLMGLKFSLWEVLREHFQLL